LGDECYRVDLLFFHRRLRCLTVIELKIGQLTHADAGQMHMYLNYAREHWMQEGEKPAGRPDPLLPNPTMRWRNMRWRVCPNQVLAREYKLALPREKVLANEIEKTRERLESRSKGAQP